MTEFRHASHACIGAGATPGDPQLPITMLTRGFWGSSLALFSLPRDLDSLLYLMPVLPT